ncbi:protein BUNDLE SHEATH DEFECTIVE 2, chloroplastic-like [Cornus florida]|uniref:protein BUNDLE SHEATH DEFECTIVE 2, chloroplastic-like n=1 Tax=Cornus florida TaxID=4283 RepID=UPI00289CBB2C|nr:protein BUNDLE SHEATH DEFECTIVE 2, chloroplastic-like [Cornus florida]
MVNSLCFTPPISFKPANKPGLNNGNSTAQKVLWVNGTTHNCKNAKFQSMEAKATNSSQTPKSNSLVCADCEGNGVILCSQCKGTAVNSTDYFNGRFKAGGLCWLCRGKKEILCGSCNGAGFVGGFMSTGDG